MELVSKSIHDGEELTHRAHLSFGGDDGYGGIVLSKTLKKLEEWNCWKD